MASGHEGGSEKERLNPGRERVYTNDVTFCWCQRSRQLFTVLLVGVSLLLTKSGVIGIGVTPVSIIRLRWHHLEANESSWEWRASGEGANLDVAWSSLSSTALAKNATWRAQQQLVHDRTRLDRAVFIAETTWWMAFGLSEMFGGFIGLAFDLKWCFVLCSAANAIITAITPVFFAFVPEALTVLMAARGLFDGLLPQLAIGIVRNWTLPEQRARHVGLVLMLTDFAELFGSVITAVLTVYGGLFCPYGLLSALSVLVVLLIAAFLADNPLLDKRISAAELRMFRASPRALSHIYQPVPFSESLRIFNRLFFNICTSASIISFIILNSFFYCTLTMFMFNMTKYLVEAYGLSLVAAAFMQMPFFLTTLIGIATSAYVNDYCIRHWVGNVDVPKLARSVSFIRKVTAAVGMGGTCLCFFTNSWHGNADVAGLVLCVSTFFNGITVPMVHTLPIDIAPYFGSATFAITHGSAKIVGGLTPLLLNGVIARGTLHEWQIVFLILSVVGILCTIQFCIFGSAELQPWAGAGYVALPTDDEAPKTSFVEQLARAQPTVDAQNSSSETSSAELSPPIPDTVPHYVQPPPVDAPHLTS